MAKFSASLILIGLFVNTAICPADSSRAIGVIYVDNQIVKQDYKPALDQQSSKDVATPKNNIARPTMVGGVR